MQIQSGKLYKNKTWLYLYPCLNFYGKDLKNNLDTFFKLGIGLSDSNIKIDNNKNNIYILFDLNPPVNFTKNLEVYKYNFSNFLEWLKSQYYYETDYVFDIVNNQNKHMIVLQIPKQHEDSIFNFMHGKYSEMYKQKDINNYFKYSEPIKENEYNSRIKKIRDILTRNKEYIPVFVDMLNKEFNSNVTVKDLKEAELDFPPNIEEETFNFE